MRFRSLALLAILSALPLAAQESSNLPIGLKLDGLRIPAELSKTIKAEKAKPGDPIELHMAEPILLGHGLIIPENAKLYGHVLGATGAEEGKPSHISLVVDRAVWKGHELPLHAVIDGFATRRRMQADSDTESCAARPASPSYLEGRGFLPGSSSSFSVFNCDEISSAPVGRPRPNDLASLSGVKLYVGNRGGYSVLLSKKNIHLQGGVVVMLKNWDAASVASSEGAP